MEIIGSQITGDLTVTSDTQYNNINAETVILHEEVVGRFYGIINKNITVKRGAIAYIHGKLRGAVINEGGIVYVFDAAGEVRSY